MSNLLFGGESNPVALPEVLLALAPLNLANRQRTRYQGDNLHVPIGGLAGRDQELLRNMYEDFNELLARMVDTSTCDPQKWADVHDWVARKDVNRLIALVRELGHASHGADPSEALAKTMHDVCGGAVAALLGRLQLLDRLPQNEGQMRMLFALTRDHLKIMRNAITGLDDVRRNADRVPKSHSINLLLNKWHDSVVGPYPKAHPIHMAVDCRFDGAVTECCLESAAIDRIFYNLATNACRHAATERIEMVIFETPRAPGENLRFVMSNVVNVADAARLRTYAATGGNGQTDMARLDPLFAPRVSSTGSGFGLTVVADFVAGAFGLRDKAEAIEGGYVGARLDGEVFRVWFHWPIANDALPAKLDDYRQPQRSLSE